MCRNPLDASWGLLAGRQRHWLPQHREGEIFRRSRLRRRKGCRTPLGSNDDGQKAGNLLGGGAVAGVRLPGLFELLDITIGAARGDDDFRRHPCSVTHLVAEDDCGYHYDEFLPKNCAAVSASSRSHLSELRPRRIRKSFAGSRDSWLLDYTPPVLGEMYRCIRVLPWPECALIAIAPRPKGGCCAGISGRATATGLR